MSAGEGRDSSVEPDRLLCLLSEGKIEVEGLIPWSSNATLLVTVEDDSYASLAVYKPQRGERPLWDFPRGTLGMREVAAYLVSEALSWCLVPPTILRVGPFGLGSLQLFIDAQEDLHYFTIQDDATYTRDLERLAAFDVIVNNADRKSGHCLVDHASRLWAIDNALTFHAEPKLRTVIWGFAGQPLADPIKEDLRGLQPAFRERSPLGRRLAQLLDEDELRALRRRLAHLLRVGHYPEPGPGRPVPWPLV